MRRIGFVFGISAVALMTFGLLVGNAQQGKGGKGNKGGGGFGGGMMGVGAKMDPLTLLMRADVKKELDISEEQSEKLPSAMMKAVSEVLNDKQMKRFRQIELQVRGPKALVKDEHLKKELKLSTSQVTSIEEILADTEKENKELMSEMKGGGGGGNLQGLREKMQSIQKESKEKVMNVLNADQKKQYKEMVGDEFKFEQPKGGFGKKKDA